MAHAETWGMSRWIPTLVLVLGLGITASAHAEGRVDWSQYLEPPGAKPMAVRTTTTVASADPVAPSRGKKAKVATKKPSKPAKAKRKARGSKRR